MTLSPVVFFEAVLILAVSLIWCEYGYHYYVIWYKCGGWPHLSGPQVSRDQSDVNNMRKVLIVSDTHIMGPIKSYTIDKYRREWLMEQAFSVSLKSLKPDFVIFMGDLLDEGSFSRDKDFYSAAKDFERIFSMSENMPRIIIPGNHDIGFHNHMTSFPWLPERFCSRIESTRHVDLVKMSGLNFVAINSMSFYNDSCPYCATSALFLDRVSKELEEFHLERPILLTHIPLHRDDDTGCEYPASIADRVKKTNVEGIDVMHKAASRKILTQLNPILIISGHTHMYCTTKHLSTATNDQHFLEVTVTSYNHKNAEKQPGFLLLSANSTHAFTKHCDLADELVICGFYIAVALTIIIRFVVLLKRP